MLKRILVLSLITVSSIAAQTPSPAPNGSPTDPMLSAEQLYHLLCYAILGSLGVLGLLLGLDRLLVSLFRFGGTVAGVQRYSSESVARILPIIIEGITVILVVLTVIILTVLRIISAEGTLGILGSVVGYVLGKSTRKRPPPSDPQNA